MEPVGAGAGGGSDPGLINGFVDRLLLVNTIEASSVRGAHYRLWAMGVQDVVGCVLTIGLQRRQL